mgnify:CR=1 FL=1
MPDIIQLFLRKGRSLLLLLSITWALTVLVLWLTPAQYKSESTSVASSVVASDPSRLFNSQIQYLYSPLGSSDQLDLLVGSGQLDTTYRPIAIRFDLVKHYELSGKPERLLLKAVKALKRNTTIYKSDYGELKVRVWDEDPEMAADLANAITGRLDSMHRDLMSRQNQQTLAALQRGLKRLEVSGDSIATGDITRYRSLYSQLIEEYTLLLEQRPPAIQVLDVAVPAIVSDKPNWGWTLIAVTAIALLLWLAFALWAERRTFYELDPDA